MKPVIELIEVKGGVYVISIQSKTPAVAVYWKHQDGTASLMRPGKRRTDIKSKTQDGKQVSIGDSNLRRSRFQVVSGGLSDGSGLR